jgi:acyl carrier protein
MGTVNMTDEIAERVIDVIAKNQHIEPAIIQPESTFKELGIDSLDGLQILFGLEEEFGVDIPDDAGKQFDSVGKVTQGIRLLLERKASASPNSA